MRKPLPQTFLNRTEEEEILADVEGARRTTADQRLRALVDYCDVAAELLLQQPNPRRTLAWQDPIAPETEALLARLHERFRHG